MPSPKQIEALKLVSEGKVVPCLVREDSGEWFARWREVSAYDENSENPWIDEVMRESAATALTRHAENQIHPSLHDAWISALTSETGLVKWDDAECAAFSRVLDEWTKRASIDYASRAQIVFELVSCGNGSFTIELEPPNGIGQYRALGEAAKTFAPLKNLRRKNEKLAVGLNENEARIFLRSAARELVKGGWRVEGCALEAEISAELEIGNKGVLATNAEKEGEKAKLVIRIAGEIASADEIRFLLDQNSTTVFFRNRWIEVDRNILKEALRAIEKTDGKKIKVSDALSFALGIGAIGNLEIEEVRSHGWLRGLLNELRAKGKFTSCAFRKEIEEIQNGSKYFTGQLRGYQSRGVAWMSFLSDYRFGALLADDMGLGKTIQTIAWICREKERSIEKSSPNLIVAPLTLLANWKHEIATFAPSLKVYVHQGETRFQSSLFRKTVLESDIVLTSYTLLVQDYKIISEIEWSSLAIDEAQFIKNPETRAAKAVKALRAPKRFALTGTPVENSSLDIWSLEEFLNPSLLPGKKDFIERFARPISHDPLGKRAKRLRNALEPFILRRLKSDDDVACELGEKRFIRQFCELDSNQRFEYERALDDWRAQDRSRGDIFALITRLKLICDGYLLASSIDGGKLARLYDLLESIFEVGESALIFTQYAKVGAALQKSLGKRFSRYIPFLHGSLSAKERIEETDKFNSSGPCAFILSLKAGGFGLNLVKASHVIHFDRWWNPAAEAQATDRAHRIGQKANTVFVHLFITSGTLEERVDSILERKLAEAGGLVASGENFLASMTREELENTIALEESMA